jgi:hypothetical protein
VNGVHTLDTKDTNIPLFEACDEVRDGGLAKLHRGQVKHNGLADKKTRRAGERCIYFFQPAYDRNHWRKNKGDVRSASHANQLPCWLRDCVHDGRLGVIFELLMMSGLG